LSGFTLGYDAASRLQVVSDGTNGILGSIGILQFIALVDHIDYKKMAR